MPTLRRDHPGVYRVVNEIENIYGQRHSAGLCPDGVLGSNPAMPQKSVLGNEQQMF
jgi:hypothetical protein